MNTATRRVVLAGATGLVGGHLLDGLLADETVAEVHVVGRRPIPVSHTKIRMHIVDLRALDPLPTADEVYLALGTTIKVAGSREAFRAVDYDANLAVAHAACQAGARRIGLVSAMGANAKSSVFYSRVKGELEDAVLRFETAATIVGPALLVAGRPPAIGPANPPRRNLGETDHEFPAGDPAAQLSGDLRGESSLGFAHGSAGGEGRPGDSFSRPASLLIFEARFNDSSAPSTCRLPTRRMSCSRNARLSSVKSQVMC